MIEKYFEFEPPSQMVLSSVHNNFAAYFNNSTRLKFIHSSQVDGEGRISQRKKN